MDPVSPLQHDTQSMVRLLGSACSRRVLTVPEAEVLEWSLVQLALEGSGPIEEMANSYRSSLLAGADWQSSVAAAFIQTPRQWGAEIQAAISSFEEIREEYGRSGIAVYPFVDQIITERAGEIPPIPGYVPLSAPEDPRPKRLVEVADTLDVSGETMELAKVLSERFPHVLKGSFKLSFDGALAALFCDLEIESSRVPRLLSVSALVSLIFKPQREDHIT